MKLGISLDSWPLAAPFVTAAEVTTEIRTVTATLRDGAICGRGEAIGVDYRGETAESVAAAIEAARPVVESDQGRDALRASLPPGGARNALDCALWDLECKRAGRRAWELAGVPAEPLTTAFTLALGSPESMAEAARRAAGYPVLKLKLGDTRPATALAAVREARPDARLVIDVNGGWTRALLRELAPVLAACGVALVEQPLPPGADRELSAADCPVPLCADESFQSLPDLERLPRAYRYVNIKLDKCGGLTEALAIAARCAQLGLGVMVGNMLGSSLAMAPAFVVAQRAVFVDLDGPLLQARDRTHPIHYDGASLHPPPPELWG